MRLQVYLMRNRNASLRRKGQNFESVKGNMLLFVLYLTPLSSIQSNTSIAMIIDCI